jgi:hypothetical protein
MMADEFLAAARDFELRRVSRVCSALMSASVPFDVIRGCWRRVRRDLGVFKPEGPEDVVALALEGFFCDRSG